MLLRRLTSVFSLICLSESLLWLMMAPFSCCVAIFGTGYCDAVYWWMRIVLGELRLSCNVLYEARRTEDPADTRDKRTPTFCTGRRRQFCRQKEWPVRRELVSNSWNFMLSANSSNASWRGTFRAHQVRSRLRFCDPAHTPMTGLV